MVPLGQHYFLRTRNFFSTEICLLYYFVTLCGIHTRTYPTLPVVLILIMYIMLIWVLRGKKSKAQWQNTMDKKLTLAIQRIVLVVILCYGPFLVWRAYFYVVVDRRGNGTLSDEQVKKIILIQIKFNWSLIFVLLHILYITYNVISNLFQGYIVTAARLLFAINCCVNPFIYAQTIPAFKKIVQNYIFGNTSTYI